MSTAPIRTPSVCPNCGQPLCLRSKREWACTACNKAVRLSWSYRRQIAYLSFLIVTLIGFATYGQSFPGPWIIGLALLWAFIGFLLMLVMPPVYERGSTQLRVTFISSILGTFVALFVVEFVGFLTLFVILGAQPREVQEQLESLSYPLAWISPQFLITRDRSFFDVVGIMLGNSFFIAIPCFLCWKVVHSAMQRSRVVQIGIEQSPDDEDD